MGKWIVRIFLVGLIGVGGYGFYDFYKAGYLSAPETSEDSFLLSFKSGFRAVMVGFGDRDEERRYLGYPADVSPIYKKDWSTCRRPSDDELKALEASDPDVPGIRWEAICEIDADGDVFIRGWVATVPRI